jgi:hypothetical protein
MLIEDFQTQSNKLLPPSCADDIAGKVWQVATDGQGVAWQQLLCKGAFHEPVVSDQLAHVGKQGIDLANEANITNVQHSIVCHHKGRGEHVEGAEWIAGSDGDPGLERVPGCDDTSDHAKCYNSLP